MSDRYGFPDPFGDYVRSHGGTDYWMRQLPLFGSAMRSGDDARYWSDYQKNTGKTPKYPGRTYSNSMAGSYYSGASFYGSMKSIYG